MKKTYLIPAMQGQRSDKGRNNLGYLGRLISDSVTS